jgi:hypothetical protein
LLVVRAQRWPLPAGVDGRAGADMEEITSAVICNVE